MRYFIWLMVICLPLFVSAQDPTIDRITISQLPSPYTRYTLQFGQVFNVTPGRGEFFRSDGIVWESGAGISQTGLFELDFVTIEEDQIEYVFRSNPQLLLMSYTDFASDECYSSGGTMRPFGPLVVKATLGSDTATLSGEVWIEDSDPIRRPPCGSVYTAPIGAVVPFTTTYLILNGKSWQLDTFDKSFEYQTSGEFDFTRFRITGDVNGDGEIDLLDITPFVEAIADSANFEPSADINGDGANDLLDVIPFVELLLN